jgi:hypothetical protein
MSLAQWAENGWLRPHTTSTKEISDLLRIVERDLQDAAGSISAAFLHCCKGLLSYCFKVFTFGHNEETFAVASFFPEFADLPFFDIVR